MTGLVSVVIPVFNTNERFRACFESVLNQKYQNIEVILVDDGSTDTSAQICDVVAQSAKRFPVFVIHKPNGGVSCARNLGIDFANGKYLVFIDSDDQVTPNYVSDFIEAREKYPDVGHIWCGFECNSQNNTKYVYSESEEYSLKNRDDYFDLSDKVLAQSPCLHLFDVSVLRRNNVSMIESLSLAEDIIFNLEYLDSVCDTEICVINAANYTYLDVNTESLNKKFRKELLAIEEYYLGVLKHYMGKWGITDSLSLKQYHSTVYYKYCDVMNNTFNKQNKMSYFEKIRYNNRIMHKQAFIDSLAYLSDIIPLKLQMAYKTKNYFFVRIYQRLISLR